MPPKNENDGARAFYHWLTPALIVALATLIAWIGSAILSYDARVSVQIAALQVQVAKLSETESYAQQNTTFLQSQITAVLAVQANHEHRITVLEQRTLRPQ